MTTFDHYNFRAACMGNDLEKLQIMLTQDTKGNLWKSIKKLTNCIKPKPNINKIEKIDFNEGDQYGQTGFYYACWKGNESVVKFLLEHSRLLKLDLNKGNVIGLTGFHIACDKGHENIVHMLVNSADKYAIDLKLKNIYGYTGFGIYFRKICDTGDLQKLKNLLKFRNKIDFNESDSHGRTGFFYACWKGHELVVKFLLDHSQLLNLDLNKANEDGWTGFHMACIENNKNIVHLLVNAADKHDINLKLKDKNGYTGLGIYFRRICETGDLQKLEKLLDGKDKIDRNQCDTNDNSRSHYTFRNGHESIVKFL